MVVVLRKKGTTPEMDKANRILARFGVPSSYTVHDVFRGAQALVTRKEVRNQGEAMRMIAAKYGLKWPKLRRLLLTRAGKLKSAAAQALPGASE